MDRIVGLIGPCGVAIEDVVRADKEEPRAILGRCPSDVLRARRVHRVSQVTVLFAAVNVRVGGGQHDPLGVGVGHQGSDLLQVANVRLGGVRGNYVVGLPVADTVGAQHSFRTHHQYAHSVSYDDEIIKHSGSTLRQG